MKFRVSKKEKYQGNNKPNIVYKNKGWNGMADFLGNNTYAPGEREWLSFNSARKHIHKLKLILFFYLIYLA